MIATEERRKTPDELAQERAAVELASHERGIVGVMLDDPGTITEICASIDHEMIDGLDMRLMFSGIATLHHAGVSLEDRNTLGAKLYALGVSEDLCTVQALRKIKSDAASHNRRWHIHEIKLAWMRRKLLELRSGLESRCGVNSDPDKAMGWMRAQLDSLAASGSTLETRRAEQIADDVLSELRQQSAVKPGVLSGLYEIDSLLGPIMPGELAIVAARPGCGKTALAMQIAQHVATRGQTLFVSLEMRDRELIRRSLSALSGVDSKKLRESNIDEADMDHLLSARHKLTGLPLEVWAPPRATMAQICAVAKYRKAVGGSLRMMLVDYIGLIRASGEERRMERYMQVGEFTAAMKSLAKELECPVVALAQLNRDAQERTPTLANLRESGSIEQDADMVLLIHHPKGERAQVIIAKHRHGQTGIVPIKWNPATTSFGEEYTEPYGGREWTG